MAEMQGNNSKLEALNQLYRQSFNPATGRIDESKLLVVWRKAGLVVKYLQNKKMFAKGRKTVSEAEKTSTESLLKRIEFF